MIVRDTEAAVVDTSVLKRALVGRAATALGIAPARIDEGQADGNETTFWEDFAIGGHVFDSLDLLEMVLVFEHDLGLSIVEAIQFEGVSNIALLAEHVQREVAPDQLREFCQKWSGW